MDEAFDKQDRAVEGRDSTLAKAIAGDVKVNPSLGHYLLEIPIPFYIRGSPAASITPSPQSD